MDTTRSLASETPPLVRLTHDLDRWGSLFLEVARSREANAAEQVLGGLVEWMGSDLLDGWLRLPIPLFEQVSELAEELLQACQAYLAWLRQTPPVPPEGRGKREATVGAILDRIRAMATKR